MASAALSAAISPDVDVGGAVSLQISRNDEPVAAGLHLLPYMQVRSRLTKYLRLGALPLPVTAAADTWDESGTAAIIKYSKRI